MPKKSLIILLTGISAIAAVSYPLLAAQIDRPVIIAQSSRMPVAVTDLQGFAGAITSLAVSPDGKTLLVAAGNGEISAIPLDNPSQATYSKTFPSKPNAITISSDGRKMAAAVGQDILVFRPEDGSETAVLRGHAGNVSALAISPDNQTLVSVSASDRTVRVWNINDEDLLETLGENVGPETAVAFTPDGQYFVTGAIGEDRTIKLWDARNYQLIKTSSQQPGYIYDVAITPDGQRIVAAVRNLVKVWQLDSGEEILSFRGARLDLNAIAVSPNGRMVATANKEGTITLWDIVTGRAIATLQGHRGWVLSLAFSPDGKYLYSGAEDKIVKIWQLSP